jgi:hypothetical protein
MSDVTALVLSIGEPYTERAIASVRCQTLPAVDTVVIRDVAPFSRAMNCGVARVRSPFFIQVDADMILDDTCIADLRAALTDGVGVVVGHLRDPMRDRVVGIKLFRTECVAQLQFRDTISPDTDLGEDARRAGWTTIYALKPAAATPACHTFGEHRPAYTPHYTFCKFMLEGARARYRRAGAGIRGMFSSLHNSTHPAAPIAVIAAAHGIFLKEERDGLAPYGDNHEFEFLQRFLQNPSGVMPAPTADDPVVPDDFEATFQRACRRGSQLRRTQAAGTFMATMQRLAAQRRIDTWVALVGLCHGLFVDAEADTAAAECFPLLRDLLPAELSMTQAPAGAQAQPCSRNG